MSSERQRGGAEAGEGAGRETPASLSTPALVELQGCDQWITWEYGSVRTSGKREKVPYTPDTGRKAKPNDPGTWGTYAAAAGLGTGRVGFMFSAHDPYAGIDLDGCRNPGTGVLAPWAQAIVERFRTYTEVSPSGTGVKLWLRGRLSGSRHKKVLSSTEAIEVYDRGRFFAVTGQHLPGTPMTIEDRQAELDAWYAEVFGSKAGSTPGNGQHQYDGEHRPHVSHLSDEAVIARARRGSGAERFNRLWAGELADCEGDWSRCDMELCGLLAYYTGGDLDQMDRLFRWSGLYRDKWEREDYRERTLKRAVRELRHYDTPRKRQDRRVRHLHDWQWRSETPPERNRMLRRAADGAKRRVREHIDANGEVPLVVTLPPGVGKSSAVAELGADYDIAWISERHDMRESVQALRDLYRGIEACTPANCPDHARHEALTRKGRNTWPLHSSHLCRYYRQFKEQGSAVYQIAHVQTAYPLRHRAIVTDELNLSNWLPERVLTADLVRSAMFSGALDEEERRLLRAVYEVLLQAEQDRAILHGKALFDTLDAQLDGRLADLLDDLARDEQRLNTRPAASTELDLDAIEGLPPVVLPHVLQALVLEVPRWRSGGEWNSAIRVSRGDGRGWALRIVERRRFRMRDGETLPPWAILDATANQELLERLLGQPVQIVSEKVDPPPRMRHVAVRTGKLYTKGTLVDGKYSIKDRQHAVAEIRYVLRELDPDGALRDAGKVGLITFQGAEEELGEALGIGEGQRAHFWALRGSNALEGCEVLLVVGTPILNLDQVEWWARALYRDDPEPIDMTTVEDEDGHKCYADPRLQGLVDYLTRAELAQAAHRNRPLRHDGRVVVTFCRGEIEYLPATATIYAFPQLTAEGRPYREAKREEDDERMWEAADRLVERGVAPCVEELSVAALKREAGLATDTVAAWLRERRMQRATPCVPRSA